MPVPQQAQHLLQQQLLQGCSKPSFLGYPDPRPPVQPASFSRTLLGKGAAGGSAWAATDFCVDSRAACGGGGDEASETPVIDASADEAGVERDSVSPAPRTAAPCAAGRPERGTRGAGHQWSPRTKPAMPQPVTPAKILREAVHDSQPPAHPFKQRSTRYVARGRISNFEQAPAARRRAKPRPGTPAADDGGTAPAPTQATPTPPPLTPLPGSPDCEPSSSQPTLMVTAETPSPPPALEYPTGGHRSVAPGMLPDEQLQPSAMHSSESPDLSTPSVSLSRGPCDAEGRSDAGGGAGAARSPPPPPLPTSSLVPCGVGRAAGSVDMADASFMSTWTPLAQSQSNPGFGGGGGGGGCCCCTCCECGGRPVSEAHAGFLTAFAAQEAQVRRLLALSLPSQELHDAVQALAVGVADGEAPEGLRCVPYGAVQRAVESLAAVVALFVDHVNRKYEKDRRRHQADMQRLAAHSRSELGALQAAYQGRLEGVQAEGNALLLEATVHARTRAALEAALKTKDALAAESAEEWERHRRVYSQTQRHLKADIAELAQKLHAGSAAATLLEKQVAVLSRQNTEAVTESEENKAELKRMEAALRRLHGRDNHLTVRELLRSGRPSTPAARVVAPSAATTTTVTEQAATASGSGTPRRHNSTESRRSVSTEAPSSPNTPCVPGFS